MCIRFSQGTRERCYQVKIRLQSILNKWVQRAHVMNLLEVNEFDNWCRSIVFPAWNET